MEREAGARSRGKWPAMPEMVSRSCGREELIPHLKRSSESECVRERVTQEHCGDKAPKILKDRTESFQEA